MNNQNAKRIISECLRDLGKAEKIQRINQLSPVTPYLNKYAVIRASGALEQSFKTIISDFCNRRSKPQVKNYINKTIREGSANPSFSNICQMLTKFDTNWKTDFKSKVKGDSKWSQIDLGLNTIVDARNDFAHGGNANVSINDTIEHFIKSCRMILILDSIVV